MLLTFLFTNHCTQKCQHCGLSSSPSDRRRLSIEEMFKYIDAAATLSNDDLYICFTGGEPFLYYNDILKVTEYAKSKKVKGVSCVTNSFWAVSKEITKNKLEKFKRAGLQSIAVSCDDFHTKFVHLERIQNVFEVANSLNLPIVLKNVIYKGNSRIHSVIKYLGDLTRDTKLKVEEFYCLPVGEAANLNKKLLHYSNKIPENKCLYIGSLVIMYDGSVYPCCVMGWPEKLLLGNAREKNLAELWEIYKNNSMFKIIKKIGPHYFIPFLNKAGGEFNDGKFINTCDLCQQILRFAQKNTDTKKYFDEAIVSWEKKEQEGQKAVDIMMEFIGG